MNFSEEMNQDTISKLSLRNAIAIDSHTVVRGAIALMKSHSLGCAIIVDAACRPTGIFSEQSIIRILNQGINIDTTAVGEVTKPTFWTLSQDEPITALWRLVVDEGVRFVAVTDQQGKLVGLSGQRGLSEYVCDCFANQIAVQRLGNSPWMLQREGA